MRATSNSDANITCVYYDPVSFELKSDGCKVTATNGVESSSN